MMMTETRAALRWCPHARQVAMVSEDPPIYDTANRDGDAHYGVANVNCIATECALWVEIEPGKGVMGCNPVMAAWAIARMDKEGNGNG